MNRPKPPPHPAEALNRYRKWARRNVDAEILSEVMINLDTAYYLIWDATRIYLGHEASKKETK